MRASAMLTVGLMTMALAVGAPAAEPDVAALVKQVRAVKPLGGGHREAVAALKELSRLDVRHLTTVLAGMDGADPLTVNWLRGAAEAIAQRHLEAGGKLPIDALEKFLSQTDHAPRARRLAYELIAAVDAKAESRLIPGLIDDPSLELRRDAVALVVAGAEAKTDKAEKIAAYQRAFRSARHDDQVKQIAAELKKLDEKSDVATHFGYVMNWKLVAPFDNVGGKGFAVAYPPEGGVDTKAEYEGKSGKIRWIDHVTTDDHGLVDLNKTLEKHKGSIAYAYSEFTSDKDQEVDIRISSDSATKVWVNGQLVASNEIYHANFVFDQYLGRATLKKGRNQILVKIAQNEQTEPWAQDWKFQLRVCDSIGTAVLSQDRPTSNTAAAVQPRVIAQSR